MSHLADWERVYRAWKSSDVPEPSCPSLNAVRDFLLTLPVGSDRNQALRNLETARDINLSLRLLAKRAVMTALMVLESDPPEGDRGA